jgi:hypothetical protein
LTDVGLLQAEGTLQVNTKRLSNQENRLPHFVHAGSAVKINELRSLLSDFYLFRVVQVNK